MNQTRFKSACEALWGPQYRSEAARQLKLGLRTVMRYDAGERDVPKDVLARLGTLLAQRQEQIAKLLAKLPTEK